MGEMADFANEYQEETLNQAHNYINGEMELNDAFEAGLVDSLGVEQFGEDVLNSASTPWNLDNQLKEQVNILESSPQKCVHTNSVSEEARNYLSDL